MNDNHYDSAEAYERECEDRYLAEHPTCQVCGERGCENVVSCCWSHAGREGVALTPVELSNGDKALVHSGACYRLATDSEIEAEQAAAVLP